MTTTSTTTVAAATAAAAGGAVDAGGLTGIVLDVVRAVGELGIALLVFVEHIVPPVPSEVVLPFAGALVADGRFTFVGVLAASTAGSVAGGWALYEVGRRLGRDRVVRWLTAVPLVDGDDVERADEWFARHGAAAVLTGRLLPGVRSLVSVPAGAQAMGRGRYLALTALGSAVWNAALIGAGVALGGQWARIEQWSWVLDVLMVAGVLAVLVQLVRRRRERRDGQTGTVR